MRKNRYLKSKFEIDFIGNRFLPNMNANLVKLFEIIMKPLSNLYKQLYIVLEQFTSLISFKIENRKIEKNRKKSHFFSSWFLNNHNIIYLNSTKRHDSSW